MLRFGPASRQAQHEPRSDPGCGRGQVGPQITRDGRVPPPCRRPSTEPWPAGSAVERFHSAQPNALERSAFPLYPSVANLVDDRVVDLVRQARVILEHSRISELNTEYVTISQSPPTHYICGCSANASANGQSTHPGDRGTGPADRKVRAICLGRWIPGCGGSKPARKAPLSLNGSSRSKQSELSPRVTARAYLYLIQPQD